MVYWFFFQFCSVIWLWMLLTGSGGELCGLLPALIQAAGYLPLLLALLPFQPLFTESSSGHQLLALSLLWCTFGNSVPLLCISFQFLVYCSVFVFCRGCQCAPRAMLVYPRGGWGNTVWWLVLTCWSAECLPSRFGAVSGGTTALLFSQCNLAWRSFPQARGSGCWNFDSPCCFISAKCGSSVSARLWSFGAHAVCFCTLVAILDPSTI
jgi:hypothetical protein